MAHRMLLVPVLLAAVVLAGGGGALASEALDYQNARKLYEIGLFGRAAREARSLLELYPDGRYRSETFYLLGESEFAQGNYEDARDAFESSVREFGRPDLREDAAIRVAECALHLGQDADALAEVRRFLQEWPGSRHAGRAHLVAGHAHRRQGDPIAALESYRAAADPATGFTDAADRETALFFGGRAALEQNDLAAAADLFRLALDPDPALGIPPAARRYGPESLYYLTETLLLQGNLEAAIATARRFAAEYPESEYLGGVLLRQARAQAARGDVSAARSLYCALLGPSGASLCPDAGEATGDLPVLGAADPAATAWAFLELARLSEGAEAEAVYGALETWLASHGTGETVSERFNPSDFLALSLLERGQLAMAAGRRAEGLASFDTLIANHPESPVWPAAVLAAIRARYEQGRHAEARDLADRLAGAEPGNVLGLLWQARLQAAMGEIGEASRSFAALAEQSAGDAALRPHVTYHRAAFLYGAEDFEGALRAFERVIADATSGAPTAADLALSAARGRTESLYQLGRYAESARAARRAIALLDASGQPAEAIRRDRAQAELTLGWSLFESGDIAGASTIFAEVQAGSGDTAEGLEALFMLGQCLMEERDLAGARQRFEAVVSASPSAEFALTALYRIAWCAYREERWDRAVEAFDRYRDSARETARVRARARGLDLADDAAFHRAWALSMAGQAAAAETAFVGLAGDMPESEYAAKAWVAAGDLRYNRQDYASAADFYRRAVTVYPDSEEAPGALVSLGWSAHAAGDSTGALAAWTEAAERYPESDLAREGLISAAELMYRNGEYRGALEAFGRVVALYPGSEEAVRAAYWSGRSLLELKEHAAAARTLREVADAHPGSRWALDSLFWSAQARAGAGEDATATAVYDLLLTRVGDIRSATGAAAILAAEALLAQGRSLERLGRVDAAAEAFRKVSDVSGVLDQTRRAALRAEGDLWVGAGKPERSLDAYRALVAEERLDETEAAAQYAIGVALESVGNYDAAVKEFLRVGNLYERHWEYVAPALVRAASGLERLNRWEEAMRVYEHLLQLAPVAGDGEEAELRRQSAARLAWIRENEAVLNLQLPDGGESSESP